MNSPLSWIGGKKALRDALLLRLPLTYKTYVEVFCGAAWLFFHKPPWGDIEILNDRNGYLTNFYECLQEPEKKAAMLERLKYTLNSRDAFKKAVYRLEHDPTATDIQRAAWFFQINRQSYAGGMRSFAAQPCDIQGEFPNLDLACARLRDVVVENQDFGILIPHFDSEGTVFYCDPPYHTTEKYYKHIGKDGFTEADHIRLRDLLLSIDGKFLLSYNDDGFIRELYDCPGIYIEAVTRLNNMRQRYDPNSQFPELFISNYDTTERARLMPRQITLFEE